MTLQFGVLGTLEVWSDRESVDIRGAKRRGLLAYLLAHAGEPQPLDRIVDALWAGAASSGSEATVRTYASQLRKLFGPDGPKLVHRAGGYVLDLEANALDASRFEAAVAAATAVSDRDEQLSLLDDALALWRGAPLDEFAGQAWADERARQWTRMHVLAHQLRAAALLDAGRHRDALPTLEQLVAAHPLHEPFWAQLVVARYRCGQQADALAAVSEARRALATELGIEPGPELMDLERKVLAQDAALDPPPSPVAGSREAHRASTVVEPLPDGVVTFLLTDIEGSTELWDLYPDQMATALVRHEDVIAEVVHSRGGRLLKSRGEGDATLSVFARATDAMAAAVALQRRLGSEVWPGKLAMQTRIALHSGEAQLRNGDYYGGTLNRAAARVRGLAAGGEILLSHATHDLVVDVLAVELELVPFGEHAMKGLRRQEMVYAVRGAGLDPRRAATPDGGPLPTRTTLIGRSDLIERIEAALRHPGLVTLSGPGGIGKTRLLHEARGRFGERFDRAWTIDLVAARDSAGIDGALQGALLPASPDMMAPADGTAPSDLIAQIVARLSGGRSLIALDNCEQLLDVLPDKIEALLDGAPNLSILATSREPLMARGEIVIRVSPLELPERGIEWVPEDLRAVESVQLLVERVRERGGDLSVTAETADDIADICRQLDGIPLALELAAARLQSTSLQDLAARLPRQLVVLTGRTSDPRHGTLRGAIGWSYQLLESTQQVLLRRLGIFVGGFTLTAAEEICVGDDGDPLPSGDSVYLSLAELVAKSLVEFDRDRSRYRLLEPIRQFARELLEQSSELVTVAQSHTRWALRRSRETLAVQLLGRGDAADDFQAELDNVHAAINWLEDRGEVDAMLRIVAALGYVWFQTEWRRGRAVADRAVALAADRSDRLRAAVLLSRGIVEQRGDLQASAVWLSEARSIYGELADDFSLAWTTFFLARAFQPADDEQAEQLMLEAATRFEALHLDLGEAWALVNLGVVANDNGRLEPALDYLERALALARKTRQNTIIGMVLAVLGDNALGRGDLDKARRDLHESLQLYENGGDRWNSVGVLSQAAWAELAASELGNAEVFLRRALQIGVEIDDEWQLREALLVLAVLRAVQHDLDAAGSLFAATGWDVDRPRRYLIREHSLIGKALRRLDELLDSDRQSARREGRARGVVDAARFVLST